MLESKIDSFANLLSREVVAALKEEMENINSLKQTKLSSGWRVRSTEIERQMDLPATVKVATPIENVSLKIEITIYHAKQSDEVNVVATNVENQIEIQIKLYSTTGKLIPQHLSMIQNRIVEASRHEIEHMTQSPELMASAAQAYQNWQQDPSKFEHRIKYYTDPAEIAAFTSGLYYKAKKLKKPFKEIMEDALKKITASMQHRGNNPEEILISIDEIRKAWLDYANIRFPKIS